MHPPCCHAESSYHARCQKSRSKNAQFLTTVRMTTCEEFEQELQEALVHLYDPDYQPSEMLCALTGCDVRNGTLSVPSAIIRVIEGLKPPPATPPGARPRRIYDLLHSRFVLKLTQEETAERLHMSVSSTRRAQREATHALARLLWERYPTREASQDDVIQGGSLQPPGGIASSAQAPDWRSQVREDLASLQRNAPGTVADVGQAIRDVVELESVLTLGRGINLKAEPAQPNLSAAIHPSALRQILIMIVGQLLQNTLGREITIHVEHKDRPIVLTLTGSSPAGDKPPSCDLIREILASQGGSVTVRRDADGLSFRIEVPSVGDVTVLVVDDNPDMIYFYRRCTEETRYHIIHEGRAQHVFEAIATYAPDVIVLDIMLPDADGWELLSDLHHHPASRSIPVITCSVIREENLALALGAALCLHKPVDYRDFIQALDQVVG